MLATLVDEKAYYGMNTGLMLCLAVASPKKNGPAARGRRAAKITHARPGLLAPAPRSPASSLGGIGSPAGQRRLTGCSERLTGRVVGEGRHGESLVLTILLTN